MSTHELVLASTSPYRSELLERLGVPFRKVAPACDEEQLKDERLQPAELAAKLARAKALSLVGVHEHSYIIGSDQLVELDGRVLGKPRTIERAVEQLRALSGRAHRLITAVALVCPDGQTLEHLDVHTLTLRTLSEAEVRRYVERDQPTDCAGSYKIERAGIALVERIEGEDFTAIVGLPLVGLTTLLRSRGFRVP